VAIVVEGRAPIQAFPVLQPQPHVSSRPLTDDPTRVIVPGGLETVDAQSVINRFAARVVHADIVVVSLAAFLVCHARAAGQGKKERGQADRRKENKTIHEHILMQGITNVCSG